MTEMLENVKKFSGGISRRRAGPILLGVGLLLGLLAVMGCSQGAYPLDIFYEMHYQKSFKSYEPPRLSVPPSAVGWFPAPEATSFSGDGQHLYQVNCSMCHGQSGQGDGPVLQRMMNAYGYTPALTPDLTSDPVRAMGAPGVAGFLRSGLVVMPNFSKLLTEEEMLLTADYVVNCLQGASPQACP
jgi:mono/diheme cytochrome c family protein